MRREGRRAGDAVRGRGRWPSTASKWVTLGKSLPPGTTLCQLPQKQEERRMR